MYQENENDNQREVEKQDPNAIKKIFQSRITNKILLFLMLFGFILTVLFGVVYIQRFLNSKPKNISNYTVRQAYIPSSNANFTHFYEYKTISNFPQFDDYLAKSVLVFDINANQIVYSKDADHQYLIASLTKLATIKLLQDQLSPNNASVITEEAAQELGSPLELKAGDIYTNRDLVKAAVIASSNQAVYALQDKSKTVEELNDYAKVLHLENTSFKNPVGFDDDGGNFSTVKELVPIAKIFFDNDILKDYAGTTKTEITELKTGQKTLVTNTNELLKNKNYPIIAGKTGTTFKAGQNLLLLIEKNGRRYFVILLGSTDRYNDAIKILGRI